MISFARPFNGGQFHPANLTVVLSNSVLRTVILLTIIVGFLVPASAQVDTTAPQATPANELFTDSITDSGDTLRLGPDGKVLNPDSVYSTPVGSGSKSFLQSAVEYNAQDSSYIDFSTSTAYLYNKAVVKYGDLQLEAGFIKINFETSELYAEGIKDSAGHIVQKPVFTESGKSYRADRMRYNFETKKAKIRKVITKEGEGYLHGEEVKKVDDRVFYVRNASYTTCSHADPHFKINTPKAKVITGDKLVTQFAYISVLDVPTPLMVPFGFFPTTSKRKSGIILPTYGSSAYRGYFLKNGGFYWAGTEYFDLSLRGDVYTQGGYALNAASTYSKRYKFQGNFSVGYSRVKYGRPEFERFLGQAYNDYSDFSINWTHNQDAKARPDFRFNSNVNIASKNYYAINSTNAEDVLRNVLQSSVSIQKLWPGKPYNLNAAFTHTQNNQTQDLRLKLPEVNFAVNRLYPFRSSSRVGKSRWYEDIGVTYNASAENEIRTKLGEPLFTESVFRDSSRNGVQQRINTSANYKLLKFVVFNPSVNYVERWYFQQYHWALDSNRNRAVIADTSNGFYGVRDFNTRADFSTTLYGLWRYKGFLRALRHKLTPRVGFSYRPDFGTDFWNYYQELQVDTLGNRALRSRYQGALYGTPGQGKSGAIDFGLQNTLEAKVKSNEDSTGVKKIRLLERLSLNSSYNLAAEEFNWSEVTLTASSSALNGMIRINYTARLDPYGYDEELGKRVNEYAYQVNGKLLRPTNQTILLGLNLNAQQFAGNEKAAEKATPPAEFDADKKEGVIDEMPQPAGGALGITEGDIDYYRLPGYVDFNVPWSLNVNYNLSQNYVGLESTIRQSLTFNGDLDLTENWKVGFSSGYDLKANEMTYTSLDFYRDLHCWDLRVSWIPFGFQQSYSITLRVKASQLRDLKLERRRGIGDYVR